MELRVFLEENRKAILERWFELTVRAYPPATSDFLTGQKDPFRNPVGHSVTRGIGAIYDQLLSGMEREALLDALDGIIRIRSVQDLSPAQAVGFIFQLKTVVRELAERQMELTRQRQQLTEFESAIDEIALLGFEKYTECREKLHQLGKPALKIRTLRVLQRPNSQSPGSDHNRGSIDGDG